MKKYIISICWIIGAIIWSIIAWTYFSENKTGLALVQIIIAFLFFVHIVVCTFLSIAINN